MRLLYIILASLLILNILGCGNITISDTTTEDSTKIAKPEENTFNDEMSENSKPKINDLTEIEASPDVQNFLATVKSGVEEAQGKELLASSLGFDKLQVENLVVAAYCALEGGYAAYLIGTNTTEKSPYREEVLALFTTDGALIDYKTVRCGYKSASLDSKRYSVNDCSYDAEGKRLLLVVRESSISREDNYDKGEVNSYQVELPLTIDKNFTNINSTPYSEQLIVK